MAPRTENPEPRDRFEPGLTDHIQNINGHLMIALPGAVVGGIGAAGVGFMNTAPFLGLSTGLKVAGVMGCLGVAAGGWVAHQIGRID